MHRIYKIRAGKDMLCSKCKPKWRGGLQQESRPLTAHSVWVSASLGADVGNGVGNGMWRQR